MLQFLIYNTQAHLTKHLQHTGCHHHHENNTRLKCFALTSFQRNYKSFCTNALTLTQLNPGHEWLPISAIYAFN